MAYPPACLLSTYTHTSNVEEEDLGLLRRWGHLGVDHVKDVINCTILEAVYIHGEREPEGSLVRDPYEA